MKKASGKSNISIVRDYFEGNRPFTQVGWNPDLNLSNRKEGEVWTDANGVKWTKKGGSKIRYALRAKHINEERCKCCNSDVRWGSKSDKSIWSKTTLCYDCFTRFETVLKLQGNYEVYNKHRDVSNEKSVLKEYKNRLVESEAYLLNLDSNKLQYFNDDGTSEVWKDDTGVTKNVLKDVQADLLVLNERLKQIDELLQSIELSTIKKIESDTIKFIQKESWQTTQSL